MQQTLKELKTATSKMETDRRWWVIRALVIATDRGRGIDKIDLEARIWGRRN